MKAIFQRNRTKSPSMSHMRILSRSSRIPWYDKLYRFSLFRWIHLSLLVTLLRENGVARTINCNGIMSSNNVFNFNLENFYYDFLIELLDLFTFFNYYLFHQPQHCIANCLYIEWYDYYIMVRRPVVDDVETITDSISISLVCWTFMTRPQQIGNWVKEISSSFTHDHGRNLWKLQIKIRSLNSILNSDWVGTITHQIQFQSCP